MQQPDPLVRKAGLNALATISEGCSVAMRRRLTDMLELVVQGLQDDEPSGVVRVAACHCLGAWAQHLQVRLMQRAAAEG